LTYGRSAQAPSEHFEHQVLVLKLFGDLNDSLRLGRINGDLESLVGLDEQELIGPGKKNSVRSNPDLLYHTLYLRWPFNAANIIRIDQ
jgi:hypothetical protein